MFFETAYSIDSRDLDYFDHCRASAILGYLQETAGLAAAQFGASNGEMVAKYRHFWMVARVHFTLDVPLRWGDELRLKTWHRGGDRTLMYRDYDLTVNGKKAGEALAVWVLADMDSRTLVKADTFPEFHGTDGGDLIRDTRVPHLRLPGEMPLLGTRQLWYSDTDANRHVNNVRYADFLCDALHMEEAGPDAFVKELQLSYLKECRPGEVLSLYGLREGSRGCVQGTDGAGEARFQGCVTF